MPETEAIAKVQPTYRRRAKGALNRVSAVAYLTIRAVLRSRLFLSLAIILFITVIGLPAAVKGDGTLAGQMRVAITYSLGLAVTLLGIATLWASCASVSQDVQDKKIQLLTTKPLHCAELWLGKWLGLLVINALLLILAGVALYGAIRWHTRPGATNPKDLATVKEEVMLSRRLVEPRPLPIKKLAHQQFETLLSQGLIAKDADQQEVLKSIEHRIQSRSLAASPGEVKEWLFDMPAGMRPDSTVMLRYRFSGASRYREPVTGDWAIGPVNSPPLFTHHIGGKRGGPYMFAFPQGKVAPGTTLSVQFRAAHGEGASSVVFGRDQGIQVLIKESCFGFNLARALAILFCQLALIAALGLTAGTIFSFPVATFAATTLLTIATFTHYFTLEPSVAGCGHDHGDDRTENCVLSTIEHIGEVLIGYTEHVVSPIMKLNPLDELSDGLLVSWGSTGKAAGLMIVFYPAVLGTLGALILMRRELALPTST